MDPKSRNSALSELWRRTVPVYLPRALAHLTAMAQTRLRELVRVAYIKVAEYGHLARDADDHDRELLDAHDNGSGHAVGTDSLDDNSDDTPRNDEDPAFAGPSG